MSGPYHVDTTQQEHNEHIVPLHNYTNDEWKSEYDKLLFCFLKLDKQNKIFKTRMADKDNLLDTTKQDFQNLLQDKRDEIFNLEKKLTGRAQELKLVYEFLLEKNIDPEELQQLNVPIFKLFHKLRQKK